MTYMTKQSASKWLILGIDLVTLAVSFFLAYLIRFNLSLSFDMSKLMIQLPVVVLIVFVGFLITGSYKGVYRHIRIRDVGTIFNVIGLSSLIVILLIMINRNWGMYPELTIPLSIIILFSLLSFAGLTTSRYFFKILFDALDKRNHK